MLDPIDIWILGPTLSLQPNMEHEIKLNQTFSGYKILIMYNRDAYPKQLQ